MTIPKHDVPEALLAPRVTQTGRADGAEWDIASTKPHTGMYRRARNTKIIRLPRWFELFLRAD